MYVPYVPGLALVVVDTLYRHPQAAVAPGVSELVLEVVAYEDDIRSAWLISTTTLEIVKYQPEADAELAGDGEAVCEYWAAQIYMHPAHHML